MFWSAVLRRVVRSVDKSVTGLGEVGSVIVGGVCWDVEGDGVVDVEEQRVAEAVVVWEDGEGESGVIWDGDKSGVVGVGVDGGDAE